jgi:mRNA-degrading endonuclease toxin of MazEF toxin-antitoxin module
LQHPKSQTLILEEAMPMIKNPSFGDVYFAELPDTGGRVIHGRRPVIVVSNHGRPALTVIPLTRTKLNRDSIRIGRECGLAQPSTVLTEQVQCIDRKQLRDFKVTLPPAVMGQIQAALFSGLGTGAA